MKRILEVKKQIGTLSKNSKNPFFKSAYLDLNDLLLAVEPLLQEQKLVLIQPIENNTVYSIIMDAESGEPIINSGLIIPSNITDPQKLGSCITYFRRYTLKSLLAISEGDDDGNSTKPKEEINLRNCKTITDLENVYKGLSKTDQSKYAKLTTELKTKLL